MEDKRRLGRSLALAQIRVSGFEWIRLSRDERAPRKSCIEGRAGDIDEVLYG